MVIHHLKVWPLYYRALEDGSKTFEIRLNDRGFRVADTLVFHEWDPNESDYTYRPILYVKVLDLFEDVLGLMEGYVIMTLGEVRTS